MSSLFKKIVDEQTDILSIFENLKSLSKLGPPENWELNRILIGIKKGIDSINSFLREYDSFEVQESEKFYKKASNLKKLLVRSEKNMVSGLESWGYEFVYSDSGKDLRKILGLKNPTIEDCMREKNILLVYRDNLKKISKFLYKHPIIIKGKENVEERINDLEKVINEKENRIEEYISLELEGKTPKMELFFSGQIKIRENSELFEDVYRKALEAFGYDFLYHGKSIESIFRKKQDAD